MALVLPHSLFVHVPKTGGSWVRAAVARAGIDAHESGPFEVHDHYGILDLPAELPKGRYTFGFVRHPVNWLKSRWAWAVLSNFPEKMRHEPAAAGHWMASCWNPVFETFVRKYLTTCPGVCTETCLRMLGWVKRGGTWQRSRWTVRFTGQYEWLHQNLRTALERAGERFDRGALLATPPQRVGARGPLRDHCHLPDDLRAEILKAESTLCILFGYR